MAALPRRSRPCRDWRRDRRKPFGASDGRRPMEYRTVYQMRFALAFARRDAAWTLSLAPSRLVSPIM